MQKNVIIILIITIMICCVTFIGCSYAHEYNTEKSIKENEIIELYIDTVKSAKYIMHAGGGINGHKYTNSLDAIKKCYDEGERLYEIDLSFSSDKKLVLAHSNNGISVEDVNIWTEDDWVNLLGQPYDENHTLASYDEFMKFEIQGCYHATSFAELIDFMKSHNDIFVMIDIGKRDYEPTKEIYSSIVAEANYDYDVLSHFIVGGQTIDMINAVKEVYSFPIINLYYAADDERERKLRTQKKFISYCRKNHILSYSTAIRRENKIDTSQLLKSDLIGYYFTTDEEDEANNLFEEGVDIVGTDFLRD